MIFDERHGPTIWQRLGQRAKAIYDDWKMDVLYVSIALILSIAFYYWLSTWGWQLQVRI